jgi:UDP-N-acetylmuramoyl-L-alanyl-D-glutamate--2,6-diaminopimelate ligase
VERVTAHTTPPAHLLSEVLAEMVSAGVSTCAAEVSSHALQQRRVEALRFAGAVFTNLTQDHLDYHATLEAYFAAKRRLFTELLSKDACAVLNRDDARVAQLAQELGGRALTFSASGGLATVCARQTRRTQDGTEIDVESPWGAFTLKTPLVGTYNVSNILGAATLHLGTGTSVGAVVEGVRRLQRVPGRLERVVHPRGAQVLVDYAHTEDALARALDAVRPYVAGGRLICVFGCGGDRDALKRPKMGAAAGQRADVVVVTSDNPRSERPEDIAAAIVEGVCAAGMAVTDAGLARRGYAVELDRQAAIAMAVRSAGRGDVVLIAGKGHEREQIFADRRVPFDDCQAALDAATGGPP